MIFFQIIVLRAKRKFIIFIEASPLKSVKAINIDRSLVSCEIND